MKQPFFVLGVMAGLLFFVPFVPAQNSRIEAPYLLPQTIFVGDQGRLVVPLSQAFAGAEPFVMEASEIPHLSPELVISRIELERRGGVVRLLIDFIPYAPGVLAFPALEFPARTKLPAITGLVVNIASVLTPPEMTLSEPASPLAVPGTSFLVYGSLVLVLLLLSLGIGGSVWGRLHFRELWERFCRRRLLRVMMKFLIRLRRECCLRKNGNPGFYLSLLSSEFREFLSCFTGINCRSLSSGEFLELPLGSPVAAAGTSAPEPLLSPVFLCCLFRSWDILRFSGRNIQMTDLFEALNETKRFIAALEMAEKERPFEKAVRRGAPETAEAV